MSYYYSTPSYSTSQSSWYSRVDNSSTGKCGVVSSAGSQQTCGGTAGMTGMCYYHESEVRAEITKAKDSCGYSYSSSNYSSSSPTYSSSSSTYSTPSYYGGGYGYASAYSTYGR